MSNSQSSALVESTAGWVRLSRRPSRGSYLLAGLVCMALVGGVGVIVIAHGKSAAATRCHQASAAADKFLRTWASGNLSAPPAQTVTGSVAVAHAYASLDLAIGLATKSPAPATASPTGRRPKGVAHQG